MQAHTIQYPTVSILIPVYNRKGYIADCIQSALTQSLADLEVVVVDNASDDGTWEICQQFSTYDPRVRIFRNENNIGPLRNWARCLEEARGVYGKILFSDDVIYPNYLQTALPILEDDEVGFVFTTTEIGPSVGSGKPWYRWRSKTGKYCAKEYLNDALFSEAVPASPGAALFRLSDLRESLVFSIPTCDPELYLRLGAGPDLLFYLLTALRYKKVGFVSDCLVFFRMHATSITIENADVKEAYKRTYLWFAQEKVGEDARNIILVRYWLDAMRRNKSWVGFRGFAHQSGIVDGMWSLHAVVIVLWRKIVNKIIALRGC